MGGNLSVPCLFVNMYFEIFLGLVPSYPTGRDWWADCWDRETGVRTPLSFMSTWYNRLIDDVPAGSGSPCRAPLICVNEARENDG
jgi:hypothetical protein